MARKAAKKTARRKTSHKTTPKTGGRYWSARVTRTSDAMDLKDHVFAQRSPVAIAKSLKRSAERSHRRKTTPFRSAMSMLNFYINRAGKNLTAAKRKKLDRAKDELRKAFDKKQH